MSIGYNLTQDVGDLKSIRLYIFSRNISRRRVIKEARKLMKWRRRADPFRDPARVATRNRNHVWIFHTECNNFQFICTIFTRPGSGISIQPGWRPPSPLLSPFLSISSHETYLLVSLEARSIITPAPSKIGYCTRNLFTRAFNDSKPGPDPTVKDVQPFPVKWPVLDVSEFPSIFTNPTSSVPLPPIKIS